MGVRYAKPETLILTIFRLSRTHVPRTSNKLWRARLGTWCHSRSRAGRSEHHAATGFRLLRHEYNISELSDPLAVKCRLPICMGLRQCGSWHWELCQDLHIPKLPNASEPRQWQHTQSSRLSHTLNCYNRLKILTMGHSKPWHHTTKGHSARNERLL